MVLGETSFVFVHAEADRWRRLATDPPPASALRGAFADGVDCWIARTFLELHRRGADVRLVDRPVPGHVCVLHADDFVREPLREDVFWVVVRPDRGPVLLADHVLVQSPQLAGGSRTTWLPHWPELDLQPRASDRGDRLERLGYVGRRAWLAPELQSDAFRGALAELGIELVLRDERWWDYRDLDAVIALRHAHPKLLATKPATKLVNAWLAGAVPLVGVEPAARAIGTAGRDYLEVRDAADVLAVLAALRHDPERVRALRQHGAARATAFDDDAVATAWQRVLTGPIAAAHRRWRTRGRTAARLRRARQRALEGLRQHLWDRFALVTGEQAPATFFERPRGRLVRIEAALRIARRNGVRAARAALRARVAVPEGGLALARSRAPRPLAPAVTVLMAVHDGERHLQETLDSVLAQTRADFELVVVDDASTDGTAALLAACRDPRLVVLRNEHNLGLTKSLGRGLAASRGEWIARLDADDVCEPIRLARQLAWLEQHPEVVVLGSWTTEIDDDGAVTGAFEPFGGCGYVAWHSARRNIVYHSTVMMRRAAVLALGGYDESMPFAQDHELWTRVIAAGGKVAILPEPLVRYRRGAAQITARRRGEQDACGLEVRRRYLRWLLGEDVAPAVIDAMRRLLRHELWAEVPRAADGLRLAERVQRQALRGADAASRRRAHSELRATWLHHAGAVLWNAEQPLRTSGRLWLRALRTSGEAWVTLRTWRHLGAMGTFALARLAGRVPGTGKRATSTDE